MSGRAWMMEEVALLGTAPDHEIAARLQRSEQAVKLYRQRRGIAPWRPQAAGWTPEEDALLGKMTNRDVARALGRSAVAVKQRRKKLGIVCRMTMLCRQCGRVFVARHGNQAVCSAACRRARQRDVMRQREGYGAVRPCAWDGCPNVVTGGRRKYCPDCVPKAQAAYSRAYHRSHRDERVRGNREAASRVRLQRDLDTLKNLEKRDER